MNFNNCNTFIRATDVQLWATKCEAPVCPGATVQNKNFLRPASNQSISKNKWKPYECLDHFYIIDPYSKDFEH